MLKSFLMTTAGAVAVAFGVVETATAAILTSNAGFGPEATTLTFDEVPVSGGSAVTNQYGAAGVTFSTNGSRSWKASNSFDRYSNNPGFNGRYLDTFTGGNGTPDSTQSYSLNFSSAVNAAGAFWEFNVGDAAAKFSALFNGALVESFTYNNVACCTSSEFIGFSGIVFNELRVSNITNRDFIMDTVMFSSAPTEPQASVPEPTTALGLLIVSVISGGSTLIRKRKEVAATVKL